MYVTSAFWTDEETCTCISIVPVVEPCQTCFPLPYSWSGPGLDFLLLACSPRMLASMSSMRYESLRKQMDKCLEHLVGDNTTVKGMGGGKS